MKPKPSLKKFLLVFFIPVLMQCKPSGESVSELKVPDFNPDIAAFTSGLITSGSYIRVRLTSDYPAEINTEMPIKEKLFNFEPSLNGNSYWIDKRTLEFRPDDKMPSGTAYKVTFRISELYEKKKKTDDFRFSFNTIPLNLSIDFKGIKSYSDTDLKWNQIEGKITTSDEVNVQNIESLIAAAQNDRRLKLRWEHSGDKNIHHFFIDSVLRDDNKQKVEVSWNGKPYGIDIKGSRDYEVPELGNFILMDHAVIHQPEQHIILRFSDPIKNNQSFEGLISLDNNTDLRFTVENNELKVFPSVRQYGSMDMNIAPGIRNILDYKYKKSHSIRLNFEEVKPAVRLVGNGVIIPDSEGLIFPFEAVNLKAVDVKVIKIFENNIAYFLQVNDLDGNNDLKRAGRLILKKTVDLIPERPVNMGEWNAFSLDLGKLIKSEPGAIYRVELSFRKKHSLFSCPGDAGSPEHQIHENEFEKVTEDEISYWDAGYGYQDYGYYDWDERNNPCSESYYNYHGRRVARNVLASNMGIIAKAGEDKSMVFAITDLRTTEPLGGVKLNIYNYQQQLLNSITTNNEGIAEIKLDHQPYLLIASKDQQKAYLRLDQHSAISLSQFEVSGAHSEKGIKGFIYGERGVWRPGDSLHLTFILEDKNDLIPDDHPVEFELSDPMGKVKERIIRTSGINGFYNYSIATDPDDQTGNWSVRIKIGSINFYKTVKIETVKPNRLKIDLDFGRSMIYSSGGEVKAKLNVKWLHGAIARNLNARVDVNFSPRQTAFNNLKDYTFTDITKYLDPVEKVIFEGRVNENGEAVFTPDLDLGQRSPGMVNAIFTVRAFEQGGDFSINRNVIPYSPYPSYIGLKVPEGDRFGLLQTDTLQEFQIVSVDENGSTMKGREVEIRVYKLDWRWWWHSSNDNLASYSGKSSHKTIFSDKITTNASGKASFKMKINYPEWGRFLVVVTDPKGGHSCSRTVYFDWPGWAGRASRKDPQAASILPFSSDKTKYDVGETAVITIPTGNAGRILLSIEDGTKVLDHYWIKATGKETTFSFTVTEDMAPNIYVNISLIQPHAKTKNDLPIRMYGVIPIKVEDPETHLYPEIRAPEVLRPEMNAEIKVSEKNAREMTYTLALVDEGLLDLTNYQTPDPWQHFYVKEALGVKTFDLYDLVLGAFGGRIDGVFSIGGGDEGISPTRKRANRFPPVVKFEGPFHLKSGKENLHKISMPNYNGSVRIMLVAGHEGAYGNVEKAVPVRKPLMVISTLPRVLSPGEVVDLPVTVFAMEDHIKEVRTSLVSNDFFDIENLHQTIKFNRTGDTTLNFKLKVKEKTGIGKIVVHAESGNEKASHTVELDIRSPNPEITEFLYGVIDKGENWEKSFMLPGMTGTNAGILEVSSIPPVDFGRRLKYLISYPHGCIEQTVSAAFPQLFLEDVMEVSENFRKVTEDNIRAAIDRLSSFSQPSGGFGYWPSSTTENDWGSSYAGHFLLEAKDKAFKIQESLLNNWIKYQRRAARNWNGNAYESTWHRRDLELTQAYRLYTLALAGEAEIGAMNRLRERINLSNEAKWRLAAAYALAGQKEVAGEIITSANTNVVDYHSSQYTYGSPLRDQALILETMTILNKQEEAVPVIRYISDNLSSDSWYSTQSTAYSLLAISKYLGKSNTAKEISYEYKIGSDKNIHAATNHPVSRIIIDFEDKISDKISLKNNSEGKLFVRLSLSGIPLAGKEESKSQNLSMEIEYMTMDGNPIDVSRLEQGTDFIAVVSILNPGMLGNYQDMALNQIFPSGWEIQNQRLFGTETGKYDIPTYQDIRDDRIYTYFNLYHNSRKRFFIKLTATYKGKFYLPGVSCEAMYRNDINAVVQGKWIEVVAPGDLKR